MLIIFHVIEGTHFSQAELDSVSWLPLVSLISYKFFFSIGYGPLPWMMNGEFFPLEAKGAASTLVTTFNWLCAFIVSKFSKNLELEIGTDNTYFLFAIICVIATFFVLIFVPETRGKSAADMKAYFAETPLTKNFNYPYRVYKKFSSKSLGQKSTVSWTNFESNKNETQFK